MQSIYITYNDTNNAKPQDYDFCILQEQLNSIIIVSCLPTQIPYLLNTPITLHLSNKPDVASHQWSLQNLPRLRHADEKRSPIFSPLLRPQQLV